MSTGKEDFASNYFNEHQTPVEKQIICAYFALTTLSTVGFGDFVPISDVERILCTFMLLYGVAIYSQIGDKFSKMVHYIKNFDKDYDESAEL